MDGKSTIYLVGGSKGGVGKSLASMALLDYLLNRSLNPFFIETDTSNPDVYKCYEGAVESELLNLDELDGWLELLNRCFELSHKEPRTIVINSGARNNTAVTKFGERLAMGLVELDAELVTLWLVNEQRDSLELLKQYQDAIPSGCIHVVCNEYFGSRFDLYEKSQMRSDLEARGGRSLRMPSLASRITADLYGGKRLTIGDAQSSMPFGNSIELRRWRAKIADMFSEVVV